MFDPISFEFIETKRAKITFDCKGDMSYVTQYMYKQNLHVNTYTLFTCLTQLTFTILKSTLNLMDMIHFCSEING